MILHVLIVKLYYNWVQVRSISNTSTQTKLTTQEQTTQNANIHLDYILQRVSYHLLTKDNC